MGDPAKGVLFGARLEIPRAAEIPRTLIANNGACQMYSVTGCY